MRSGFGRAWPTRPGTSPTRRSSCPKERRATRTSRPSMRNRRPPPVGADLARPARRSPRARDSRRSRRVRRRARQRQPRSRPRRSLAARRTRERRRPDRRRRSFPPLRTGIEAGGPAAGSTRRRATPAGRRSGPHRRSPIRSRCPRRPGERAAGCRAIRAAGVPGAGVGAGGTDPGRQPDHAGPEPPVQAPVRGRGRRARTVRRVVELWLTQDGGRTWIRRRRGSGQGLAVRGRSGGRGDVRDLPGGPLGLGTGRSAAGTRRPAADLGRGRQHSSRRSSSTRRRSAPARTPARWRSPGGPATFTWRRASVSLFWRPDQPGATWQPIVEGQENMGQYVWTVPPSFPAQVPPPGRGRRHRRPSGRSRDDRCGAGHRRSQPAPEPDHRPGPERPRRRRTRRPPAAVSRKVRGARGRSRRPRSAPRGTTPAARDVAAITQAAGPSRSLTASRSEISSAAEASSRFRASSSIGRPWTIDQLRRPRETSGKL